MKKRWWLLAALGAAALAAAVVWKTGGATVWLPGPSKKPDQAALPLEFLPTEVLRPSLTRMPELITFSGPLVAPQTAVVRARAGGRLQALDVAEGARVRAGQPLGRIELAEMDTRVAERGAQVQAARATLAQAERAHASNAELAAQQFISNSALDSSRAALDTARANLQAAQASLDTTRVGERDALVSAPIAGIVAKRHALAGETVSPEQSLLTIVDLARLELAGSVATHQVARLQIGMPVRVQVEGLAIAVQGRLARIAPAAEPGSRALGVTVDIANPRVGEHERLRAGPYAMAQVVLEDDKDRLSLPLAAIATTAGQSFVWGIEEGKLVRRAVQLGKQDEAAGLVEVLQGVNANSQVLAARFENLREGAQAQVVPARGGLREATATPAAASSAGPR